VDRTNAKGNCHCGRSAAKTRNHPKSQYTVFQGMAGQARHDRLVQGIPRQARNDRK